MSPITKVSEAKEGGFAQVREALVSFEGDVVSAEFSQWGGKLLDDDGKPVPPREFMEVVSANNKPLEVTEDLTMDITEKWTFRINCSDFRGSFWVDAFLVSADKAKILIPDGIVGKRVTWRRFTLEAKGKGGVPNPKFNSTNFVIEKVAGQAPKVTPKPTLVGSTPRPVDEVPAEPSGADVDPMEIALELAIGKTETQFRSAISLHPVFINSQLLPLAKAGAITMSLLKEGKLIEVQEGTKKIYRRG